MNQLEDLFYSIEAGTYQKEDNSFYQNKLQQMSDDGGLIATIRLGLLTDNPFLANVGPKINLKYKTISAITSTVEENIENYGVNHVMVSLKIVIKIRLMVLFPFYNEEFSHEYDYPLVMEVIEGEVPNWYQNYIFCNVFINFFSCSTVSLERSNQQFAVTQTYLSPYGSSGIGGMKGSDGMVHG
ncbi:MAG: sporulation protein YunB [Thomasclavelia ramosa]